MASKINTGKIYDRALSRPFSDSERSIINQARNRYAAARLSRPSDMLLLSRLIRMIIYDMHRVHVKRDRFGSTMDPSHIREALFNHAA